MELGQLAVPAVYVLISFLAYSSQWLLLYLEPYPLERKQLIRFNGLLIALLITYSRSVLVDPGRILAIESGQEKGERVDDANGNKAAQSRKWCRKCNAVKPPRAHHCRECKRYYTVTCFQIS